MIRSLVAVRSLSFFALITCASAFSATPVIPTEPELRIETGAHLSLITRVSADANGRWILTASEDKTARLWDAASGSQIAVLRPPIGAEAAGALYAAALSPDGKQAALGGNAGFDGRSHALYLFDRATANLPPKSTLSGLEAPITQLAWSRDSQFIAVGMRQQGLRVFRRNLGFVGSDAEYNEAIYGADFSRDGRLATTSPDGALRLYEVGKTGLDRVARKSMPNRPYAVAFSPDGTLLAVGYADVARVDVLDATSLVPMYSAEVSSSGNLGRVAWSGDGRTLYAAGSANSGGRFMLYAFADAGRGRPREVAGFSNIVTAVAPLGNGVVAATAEPAWASFDATGAAHSAMTHPGADFRDAGDSFRLAADGRTVAFPTAQGGRDGLVFDLVRGELRTGSSSDLGEPQMPFFASLKNWKNSAAPTLNGQILPLRSGEIVRSAAYSADKKLMALGTEWNLRLFDSEGGQRWERRTPAAAWAVNVSADGRWLVAALGDGSIRWYRLSDGQEQLALYVHGDKNRWILWTPSGYYDTSVGGEDLVGWHLNRAFNQAADFYSVGRFRSRFYRPEVVQQVLQVGDEAEAVRRMQAAAAVVAEVPAPAKSATKASAKPAKAVPRDTNEKPAVAQILPPKLDLLTDSQLETSADVVTVRYAVRSPADAPTTNVKLRVDGKLVRSIAGTPQAAARTQRNLAVRDVPAPGEPAPQEVQVPIPAKQDVAITLQARNKNGVSEPVIVRVVRTAQGDAAVPPVKFDKLYLFAVGVSTYPNLPAQSQLRYPAKDARDFSEMFSNHAAKLYNKAEIRVLQDAEATRQNVLEGLKWLEEKVGPNDVGILFLAGHGFLSGNNYYFAGYDIADPFGSGDKFQKSGVPGSAIQEVIANLKGRGVFFLDTCHSGFALNSLKVNSDINGMLNEAEDEKGVVVLSGAGGKQAALEDDRWQNGAFTYAIKEGILKGRADMEKDGRITPPLLHTWVSKKMREMTKGEERPPTPKMVGAIFNEPFIVIK